MNLSSHDRIGHSSFWLIIGIAHLDRVVVIWRQYWTYVIYDKNPDITYDIVEPVTISKASYRDIIYYQCIHTTRFLKVNWKSISKSSPPSSQTFQRSLRQSYTTSDWHSSKGQTISHLYSLRRKRGSRNQRVGKTESLTKIIIKPCIVNGHH